MGRVGERETGHVCQPQCQLPNATNIRLRVGRVERRDVFSPLFFWMAFFSGSATAPSPGVLDDVRVADATNAAVSLVDAAMLGRKGWE